MGGTVDHVGSLARDLDAAIAQLSALLGMAVARRFERPQLARAGAYLGPAPGQIEVFTCTDAALLARRLAGRDLVLDHVAYQVPDIATAAAELRAAGAHVTDPDLETERAEPAELGGLLRRWTRPETTLGQSIQLLQR